MSDLEKPLPKRTKLPPISKKDDDGESPGPSEPRPRRKKKAPASAGEGRPRSTSRTRRASGSGAQAADESDEVKPKPKAKKKSASPTRAEATDDGETPRKKKTTKKKPTSSSREQLMSDGDGNPLSDRSTKSTTKKRRRKKKPTSAMSETEEEPEPEIGLEAELRELQDDVIAPDADVELAGDTHWNAPAMRSEPVNKLFIEQRNGFKTADKAKVARRRAEAEQQRMVVPVTTSTQTTIEFALGSHKIFKALSLFIQGLFSGLTLWQIVQTWTLSDQGVAAFLDNYYFLAWPVQSVYYFLFVISTVSAFDRYDISRPTRDCSLKAITLQSGAVSCFFYFVGLVFSVSIAATDQKIGMYKVNPSLWGDENAAQSEINRWRILNMVRGIMAMIGWLIVSLRPRTDRLTENLERGQENMMGDEPDNIMLDPVRSSGV